MQMTMISEVPLLDIIISEVPLLDITISEVPLLDIMISKVPLLIKSKQTVDHYPVSAFF